MSDEVTRIREWIEKDKEALGVHEWGILKTEQLSFHPQVRELCRQNYCGHYGKSWCCPPAVGTLEECQAKALRFGHVFVYSTLHPLEDSFDFEGMMEGRKTHTKVGEKVEKAFREVAGDDLLVLAGDGCTYCRTCTYPSAPCRFPDRMHPSVESYGVQVNRITEETGMHYINGQNTVTYFGCILW